MIGEKFRKKIHSIIFEADTKAGKVFDILLFTTIAFSVIIVMLNSDRELHDKFGDLFLATEWIITILFTLEYIFRIYAFKKPFKYIFSFYGVIDLLSILPTYISLFVTGAHMLLVIRMLRLMRIFRVFKLARYVKASNVLFMALKSSRIKIVVFLEVVMIIVVITGSVMYLVEGDESGFTSIPKSIYWAIVTITTVGYGDIAPQTVLGQTIASMLMIVGFAIIAVPTSIIGSELVRSNTNNNTQVCQSCNFNEHDDDAKFCKKCGDEL
jgi:voltage-gated potassium channel